MSLQCQHGHASVVANAAAAAPGRAPALSKVWWTTLLAVQALLLVLRSSKLRRSLDAQLPLLFAVPALLGSAPADTAGGVAMAGATAAPMCLLLRCLAECLCCMWTLLGALRTAVVAGEAHGASGVR